MGFPCDLMEVGFRVEGLGLRGLGVQGLGLRQGASSVSRTCRLRALEQGFSFQFVGFRANRHIRDMVSRKNLEGVWQQLSLSCASEKSPSAKDFLVSLSTQTTKDRCCYLGTRILTLIGTLGVLRSKFERRAMALMISRIVRGIRLSYFRHNLNSRLEALGYTISRNPSLQGITLKSTMILINISPP